MNDLYTIYGTNPVTELFYSAYIDNFYFIFLFYSLKPP